MNIYFKYFRVFSIAVLVIFAPLEAIAVCGRIVTGSHCDVIPFNVFDEIGSEFSTTIVDAFSDGHGSVRVGSSGLIQYVPTPQDAGDTIDVTVDYYLDQDTTQVSTCVTRIVVTNNRPEIISCPSDVSVARGSTGFSQSVKASDRDPCDALTYRLLGVTPTPSGQVRIDPDNGKVTFTADEKDAPGRNRDYEICLEVSDRIATDTCCFTVTVLNKEPFRLRIDENRYVYHGQVIQLPIIYDAGTESFEEFNFLVGYDRTFFSVVDVRPGNSFSENGSESFNFGFEIEDIYHIASANSAIRIIGKADDQNRRSNTNRFAFQPGDTIAILDIRASSDRSLTGLSSPIRWLWTECKDNSLIGHHGKKSYISSHVYDFRRTGKEGPDGSRRELTDTNGTLPSIRGAPESCVLSRRHNPSPERFAEFLNGLIWFVGLTVIDERGDLNLNGLAYDTADAELYCEWFIKGNDVFSISLDGQISAADINSDGSSPSVEDFVNMMRIMNDDSIAIDNSSHFADTAVIFCRDSVYVTDTELGAAYFTFEGDADVTLLADNMSMRTAFHKGETRAIVYSFGKEKISPGKIISCDRQLLSLDAADYFGHALGVSSDSSLFDYSTGGLKVRISQTDNTVVGQHEQIHIVIDNGLLESGGFDFLIGYDYQALSFTGATAGNIFLKYGWEFFTYRFGPNINCTGNCPVGKLRVIGIADTNNGLIKPNDFILRLGDTLATLGFLVTSDRNISCKFLPVRWLWADCHDNAFSSKFGDELFISDRVFDYERLPQYDSATGRVELTDPNAEFPTNGGAPFVCDTGFNWQREISRNITFLNGGVGINCPAEIDARGDLNFNGVGFEIEDGIIYCFWLAYGFPPYELGFEIEIAAADINNDGYSPTLEDFVYFIRHVTGDAIDESELNHFADTVIITNASGVYSCDRELGAIMFSFQNSAEVELLAENMDLRTGWPNFSMRVLVHDIGTERIAPGAIIRSDIAPINIDAADYNGNALAVVHDFSTSIGDVDAAALPTEFALNQNYPNPFNPSTTIEVDFPRKSAYTLTIFNILGRVVERFAGAHEAGTLRLSWDGAGHPSGVYFYKLSTDAFSESKSMLMIK